MSFIISCMEWDKAHNSNSFILELSSLQLSFFLNTIFTYSCLYPTSYICFIITPTFLYAPFTLSSIHIVKRAVSTDSSCLSLRWLNDEGERNVREENLQIIRSRRMDRQNMCLLLNFNTCSWLPFVNFVSICKHNYAWLQSACNLSINGVKWILN